MHTKNYLGIIPARYGSDRFPGKPLADIQGKTMIRRVYERAMAALDRVIVATDDERIVSEVKNFGGRVVLTSPELRSGTDRCAEALKIIEGEETTIDVVINIQGDEPFIRVEQIEALKSCFSDDSTDIATLISRITDPVVLSDPNRPKVVIDSKGFALYFSRSIIPFVRGIEQKSEWHLCHSLYQHIGMYAFKIRVLKEISLLPESLLEKAESLEQLRWLENGYRIKTAVTPYESFGIDTPEDLRKALEKKFD